MNKKIYILSLFVIIINNSTFAQSQSDFNYSIGINLFSYGSIPKINNEIRSADSFKQQNFGGFLAKFNDNQFSIRLAGNRFFKSDYSFYNECKECETVKGKYTSYEFKVGFEKSVLYSKVQPIFGTDIGFKSITFNGKASPGSKGNESNDYFSQTQKDGVLLYPFVGIKYSPINFITVAIESGFNILYSNEQQNKIYGQDKIQLNRKQWEFLNQPIGMFSIQFNFGEN